MEAKAELDEFRIFKAQMNKHLGIQNRWSRKKLMAVRKKSDVDPEKYNQIVVDDEQEVEHEYKSEYRGKVQDKQVDTEFKPMYELSYTQYSNGLRSYQAFDKDLESFNNDIKPLRNIYITCNPKTLSEEESRSYFTLIDTVSSIISKAHNVAETKGPLMQRAVAYSVIQNFEDAISDLNIYAQIDSVSSLLFWQRGVCEAKMIEYNASRGMIDKIKVAKAISDFDNALKFNPQNAYIYYDRANIRASQKDYERAIDDYTIAIKHDSKLAEAYFNRGLARIFSNNKEKGIEDLSKAGELGLYDAYSVIKKYSSK
jgi:tetratricopeptide (TPR) repeat protein